MRRTPSAPGLACGRGDERRLSRVYWNGVAADHVNVWVWWRCGAGRVVATAGAGKALKGCVSRALTSTNRSGARPRPIGLYHHPPPAAIAAVHVCVVTH